MLAVCVERVDDCTSNAACATRNCNVHHGCFDLIFKVQQVPFQMP